MEQYNQGLRPTPADRNSWKINKLEEKVVEQSQRIRELEGALNRAGIDLRACEKAYASNIVMRETIQIIEKALRNAKQEE